MTDVINGFRTDNVFGIISLLLKCDRDYRVKFMCGDEIYEIKTGCKDPATKTVIFDLVEVTEPPIEEQYEYILNELKENPSLTVTRLSREDVKTAVEWALSKIEEMKEED